MWNYNYMQNLIVAFSSHVWLSNRGTEIIVTILRFCPLYSQSVNLRYEICQSVHQLHNNYLLATYWTYHTSHSHAVWNLLFSLKDGWGPQKSAGYSRPKTNKQKSQVLVCLFCFVLFLRQGFSVALDSVLKLALVQQAGLKLTEICLPLSS